MSPVYDYDCPECGRINDHIAKISEVEKPCPECGGSMSRLFSPPTNIITDLQPYLDEHMGHEPVYVKSKQHKRQLLKERKLVELG